MTTDDDTATAWMHEGNCRLHPPATFFPSDGVGVDRARKICSSCPVTEPCLECLGACGFNTPLMVNEKFIESVTVETVPALLASLG